MRIERLEYFWGLFESSEEASSTGAEIHVCWEAPNVPVEVEHSFLEERIVELSGEHGLRGVGDPTEVDSLVVLSGGENIGIRVENRGISLFRAETEDLKRLHRFFSVLHRRARSRNAP